ncbi:MAG: ABC transporter ATP-binding protein [Haloferacaceae archaeon]
MAAVTFDNVTKVFESDAGPLVAVKELDFEVNDGEFVVLVGPSGCGKSTTLRMLAGLDSVTDGEIRLDGEVINNQRPKDRDIAMVFQSYALYPHKTVYGNMAYGLQLSTDLDDAEIERRVNEAAEMMGIDDLLDKKPSSLSGGQQQRVATGRAIVREPSVFLFDEPLSNLDAKLRKHMRTELSRIHAELGITTIYVTHDQEEAMTMADRIVVLDDGELQQIGTPKQVYYRPANEFVADFIGSPSMNFFDVEVRRSGTQTTLVGDGFEYHVSEQFAEALDVGNAYRLGVRPEDVSVADSASTKSISATVDVVEVVGSDNFIYFDVAGSECRARTSITVEPSEGTEAEITFDEEKIHLFEAGSGEAVLHGYETTDGESPESAEASIGG